jgi:hypothetical protein
MAKKNGINKTQAIREYFKANKKATNKEVVDAMAKKGITVSANYVSTIKTKHNKRGKVAKKAMASGEIGVSEIKAALSFLKAVGSVSAARQALVAAEEIRKIV